MRRSTNCTQNYADASLQIRRCRRDTTARAPPFGATSGAARCCRDRNRRDLEWHPRRLDGVDCSLTHESRRPRSRADDLLLQVRLPASTRLAGARSPANTSSPRDSMASRDVAANDTGNTSPCPNTDGHGHGRGQRYFGRRASRYVVARRCPCCTSILSLTRRRSKRRAATRSTPVNDRTRSFVSGPVAAASSTMAARLRSGPMIPRV